jgi:ribonuclease HI
MAEYLDEEALNIYTDGSAFSSPRRGGVGVLFVSVDARGNEVRDEFPLPGFADATNNMMELQAPIEALRALTRGYAPVDATQFKKIVFWTDSRYLAENFQNARHVWSNRRWMTSTGNPVVNVEQWKELVKLVRKTGKRVEVRWIKGHRQSSGNKRVDRLAKQSAKTQVGRRLGVPQSLRRKHSPNMTEPGSVRMLGQVETIRVIDAGWAQQGFHRYRYEVVDEESEFFEKVDFVFAERHVALRAGHTYEVRFNEDTAAPRIVEVLAEQ